MLLHDAFISAAEADEAEGVMEIDEILHWAVPQLLRTARVRQYMARRVVLPEAQLAAAIICRVAVEMAQADLLRMLRLAADQPFPVPCLRRVGPPA
ncbi:MAG TPA: hypothetical protein VK009_25410 [Chloroflexota bacterium]|nr:hypothetical protein [Chloroflexota bacterium]